LAGFAAVLSVGGWAFPPLFGVLAFPVILILFFLALIGIALLVISSKDPGRQPHASQRGLRVRLAPSVSGRFFTSLTRRQLWGIAGIVVAAVMGVVTAVATTATMGVYSQNPPWTISKCEWSVGTNHGATNICVSHARWLEQGEEFKRAFTGIIALFLAVEALIFLARRMSSDD
jgi:hypothetical protein